MGNRGGGRAVDTGGGPNCVGVALLIVLLLAVRDLPILQNTNTSVSVEEVSVDALCAFLASLARDLGTRGKCLAESPVAEPNVCYTSTNFLAARVLREVCGLYDLASSVEVFLKSYPTDFYDYYQVLYGRPIELPFRAVTHVTVDTVGGVDVRHVVPTDRVIEDYDSYANLLVYKALHHLQRGEVGRAREELDKLGRLFDGRGFVDSYFKIHGLYETYKLALASIAYRAIGEVGESERYSRVLRSLRPLATLYLDLAGVGDLNVETATLVLLAISLFAVVGNHPGVTVGSGNRGLSLVVLVVVAVTSITLAVLHFTLRRGLCRVTYRRLRWALTMEFC